MEWDDVQPVAERYAAAVLRDPDVAAIAVVLAWWAWRNRQADFPPSVYARIGVRNAKAGRDLPGIRSRFRDAMDRAWQGGMMREARDHFPGPDLEAADREAFEGGWHLLTPRERQIIEMALEGLSGLEMAARLGVSPGRVTQLRQAAARKLGMA